MKSLSPQQINRLQQMLTTAQQAAQSGLFPQAERLYKDILLQAPEAWDVHQQLAILFARTNRPIEAIKHFRLIVKANPTYAPGHANLANALAESGNLDEAIAEFRRSLALDKTLNAAKIALGETLRRVNNFEESIKSYKEVLDQDKTNHAAFRGLGLVYRDMEDWPRALECFEHAVGLNPRNHEYRLNFGAALRSYKLDYLAADQFYEAVKLQPNNLDAIVLLAETLEYQRRFDEAKECFDRAIELNPTLPELHERLGYVYLEMADTENALHEFRGVLSSHPQRFMAQFGLGRCHMEAGHSSLATESFETLIQKFPDNPSGYFLLAVSRKFKPEDPFIPKLLNFLEKIGDDRNTAISLNFALGKIYDDCKLWDQAFHHYELANRAKNEESTYNFTVQEKYFDRLISTFNSQFFKNRQNLGTESSLPIIIVGMPRSGTTLTEQIISSHPKVIGAGEVIFWPHARESVPYLLGTEELFPECMSLMSQENAIAIADRYTSLLKKIAGDETQPKHITDKMPHNFINLGLIALLFPNAPIVHCRRDPMDNCLSIFFQHFSGAHTYAYDLKNIGHHHREYERLMKHWHEVFPGRIMDINYEDTIADPEYWSRKLIEHVGLEWDDACLAPHKLERTVKTASHWQVRQPIYKTSVKRWKNYEKHLGPLKEALGYKD